MHTSQATTNYATMFSDDEDEDDVVIEEASDEEFVPRHHDSDDDDFLPIPKRKIQSSPKKARPEKPVSGDKETVSSTQALTASKPQTASQRGPAKKVAKTTKTAAPAKKTGKKSQPSLDVLLAEDDSGELERLDGEPDKDVEKTVASPPPKPQKAQAKAVGKPPKTTAPMRKATQAGKKRSQANLDDLLTEDSDGDMPVAKKRKPATQHAPKSKVCDQSTINF